MTTETPVIPEGHHSITPYLCVRGAGPAIEFYKKAFGAIEALRVEVPGGRIGHAEIQIGDSRLMLADEFPELNFRGPQSVGGTPVHIHLYVEDADLTVEWAVTSGARLLRPVEDRFYGDRTGSVEDPFGHVWHVATHREDLSAEELKRRAARQPVSPQNRGSR